MKDWGMVLRKDFEIVVGVDGDLVEVGKREVGIQIDGGEATGGDFI